MQVVNINGIGVVNGNTQFTVNLNLTDAEVAAMNHYGINVGGIDFTVPGHPLTFVSAHNNGNQYSFILRSTGVLPIGNYPILIKLPRVDTISEGNAVLNIP
jgi:hypothetical protein